MADNQHEERIEAANQVVKDRLGATAGLPHIDQNLRDSKTVRTNIYDNFAALHNIPRQEAKRRVLAALYNADGSEDDHELVMRMLGFDRDLPILPNRYSKAMIALILFRDFVTRNATQWAMGAQNHPIWEMMTEIIPGDYRDLEDAWKPFTYATNKQKFPLHRLKGRV